MGQALSEPASLVTRPSPLRNTLFISHPYAQRVPVFLVRVVLADRPGALGAVASRIGAVRGDVVGFDILERAEGRAVDEFMVELSDEAHLDLLVFEIEQVDGTAVEHVRPLGAGHPRGRLGAYEAAVTLAAQRTTEGVLERLAALAAQELDAEWVAVVEVESRGAASLLSSQGRPPAARWLAAYAGEQLAHPGPRPDPDVTAAALPNWDLALVAGRPGWPFGAPEQRRLEALAALADARWVDLARSAHPSCAG